MQRRHRSDVGPAERSCGRARALLHPESLQRCSERIRIEHWIDLVNDLRGHIEKIAFVLNWYERSMAAVLHAQAKRLVQRSQGFQIPLNRHVAEDHQRWQRRALLESRVDCDEQGDTGFTGDTVRQ